MSLFADNFRAAMVDVADAINDEMGEAVIVTPATSSAPNFPTVPQAEQAVGATAVFLFKPEMVFKQRGGFLVEESPGISTNSPRFSFKRGDLPWPMLQGYRIERCIDGALYSVTDVKSDGMSRIEVAVSQLGRARE